MAFVNKLADGVAAQCPGVKTEILAYLFQRPTPRCSISRNVAWVICPLHCRSTLHPVYHPLNNGYFGNFTTMQACGGEMRVYDYHAFDAALRLDGAFAEVAAEDYRWYARHGVRNIGSELAYVTDPNWPTAMMNGWLFGRVGWTADIRDVEGLRKWYIRRVYRRRAIRGPVKWRNGTRMLVGEEAREVFGRYLDAITNPIARWHYETLMKKAVAM